MNWKTANFFNSKKHNAANCLEEKTCYSCPVGNTIIPSQLGFPFSLHYQNQEGCKQNVMLLLGSLETFITVQGKNYVNVVGGNTIFHNQKSKWRFKEKIFCSFIPKQFCDKEELIRFWFGFLCCFCLLVWFIIIIFLRIRYIPLDWIKLAMMLKHKCIKCRPCLKVSGCQF